MKGELYIKVSLSDVNQSTSLLSIDIESPKMSDSMFKYIIATLMNIYIDKSPDDIETSAMEIIDAMFEIRNKPQKN